VQAVIKWTGTAAYNVKFYGIGRNMHAHYS